SLAAPGPHGDVYELTMTQQFTLELSNQRVDANKLRAVTWQQMDAAKANKLYKFYSYLEKVIESSDPKIAAFVTQVLGANYRKTLTPYDAARQLFQAVVKQTTYYYGADRPDTAVKVLDQGRGDCGGFSL